jgi:hypothetical protein
LDLTVPIQNDYIPQVAFCVNFIADLELVNLLLKFNVVVAFNWLYNIFAFEEILVTVIAFLEKADLRVDGDDEGRGLMWVSQHRKDR